AAPGQRETERVLERGPLAGLERSEIVMEGPGLVGPGARTRRGMTVGGVTVRGVAVGRVAVGGRRAARLRRGRGLPRVEVAGPPGPGPAGPRARRGRRRRAAVA